MIEIKKQFTCSCKKVHNSGLNQIIVEKGAINKLPSFVNSFNKKSVFLVCDKNTYIVGGKKAQSLLYENNLSTDVFLFPESPFEPDDTALSLLKSAYKNQEIIVAVGSGVINDLCKILSCENNIPYIIIASQPSMDGYASKTSSIISDGLKITVNSKVADVIIGDIDILKTAPDKALISGFGDMIAKYISILEWKISSIINDEYYCEEIANLIKTAVKECVDNLDGLLNRDEKAIEAVFNGLILGGVGMNYAGCSRPASGVEHYFSHIWDMRALEFNTPLSSHGIQCGIGTLYAIKIYEQLKNITPNKEKAVSYVKNFDFTSYSKRLKDFIGKASTPMIENEKADKKYDAILHFKRIDKIISSWDKIVELIRKELPKYEDLKEKLKSINAPTSVLDIGLDESILPNTFTFTKDIRNKYVLSTLCFDLGIDTSELIF
jgi:glycerol-1-phosphate dehydrogenase [NAD(P)+]